MHDIIFQLNYTCQVNDDNVNIYYETDPHIVGGIFSAILRIERMNLQEYDINHKCNPIDNNKRFRTTNSNAPIKTW